MKENGYVRIAIKDHREKNDDIVCRRLHRAFTKLGNANLINGDRAFLYGQVEEGKVYELITGELLNLPAGICEDIDEKDILDFLKNLRKSEIGKLYLLIKNIIFGENVDIDFMEVSTLEERAKDRAQQFHEYTLGLTDVSPYDENHMKDYDDIIKHR